MSAKLVARTGFSAFGVEYGVGDEILHEHHSKWPTGALANRLNNGDAWYVGDQGDPGTDPELKLRIVELQEQLAISEAEVKRLTEALGPKGKAKTKEAGTTLEL